jgi:diguanylate cyclase (GGDEF)-like protein
MGTLFLGVRTVIEAPLPTNEHARLAALHKTQLLDTPLEERFERITRLVCRLLGVPVAAVSLVDQSRQWFKSVQGSLLSETSRKVALCSHAILSDQTMLIPDTGQDPRFADNPHVTGPEQIAFYAGHPLKALDGSRVGVLCAIDHKPRDFSNDDLQTLRDLAALAEAELNANTLKDAQNELLSQLAAERRRALIDPLTRLWNRDGIMEILTREHARALREHAHLGVLMADIDFFKRINDTHGHPVGDAVLRDVAKQLLTAVREYDAVGRLGGEEFLIVMPIKPGAAASVQAIASRVCRQVRETPCATPAGRLSLTISIGGVDETLDSANVDELIKKADDALYRAKQLGRNRAEIHTPAPVVVDCA